MYLLSRLQVRCNFTTSLEFELSVTRTRGCVLLAVAAHMIEVESHIAAGLVGMQITGLADTSINESRDRVRSAIQNTGLEFPQKRITVGLSPAALPKHGSALDLPIAISLMAASSIESAARTAFLNDTVWFGELALDGRVRPVRGVLLAAIAAKSNHAKRIVVPYSQHAEASLVQGLEVIGISSLAEGLNLIGWELPNNADSAEVNSLQPEAFTPILDLQDVKGQKLARYALEVSAAGGHHIALLGSPGVGKTLLASRLPSILPQLALEPALEVTAIASLHSPLAGLITSPPFSAPHHTASYAALIGGGTSIPQLGLVTKAHQGVLFLDEAPEFASNVLDALRLPLESGEVELNRRTFNLKLPAKFQLVIAANPCPCGYALDVKGRCGCTPNERRRYLARISGPLLDRIDIRVVVDPPSNAELQDDSEPSSVVRERVIQARNRAAARFAGTEWNTNAEIPGPRLREFFPLSRSSTQAIHSHVMGHQISPRGLDRIAQLAWSVADLKGNSEPDFEDVKAAVELRNAGGRWVA
ncbi:MAG: Competence protein ComM [Actinomycetota bacterium]